MKYHIFRKSIIVFTIIGLSAISASAQQAMWKVLWVVAPNINAPKPADNGGGICNNGMTIQQREWCSITAPQAFEQFIESHSNGKLDIQITVDVLASIVTEFDVSPDIKGVKIPDADKARLNIEGNYDCLMIMANYSGCNLRWAGVTYNYGNRLWVSQVPMYYNTSNLLYQNNVAIHEWIHQIEIYFPQVSGGKLPTPVLHNDGSQEYLYTEANTGLSGEDRLAKWYGDYIQGSIIHYPGATSNLDGIHSDWWQYNPLRYRFEFEKDNADGITLRYRPIYPNDIELVNGTNVSGVLKIPETVTHNNITYAVTRLADNLFLNNADVTEIEIPNSVTYIGWGVLANNGYITKIKIGFGIKTIRDGAFFNAFWSSQGNLGAADLTITALEPPVLEERTLLMARNINLPLKTPYCVVADYQAAAEWSEFGTIIPIRNAIIPDVQATQSNNAVSLSWQGTADAFLIYRDGEPADTVTTNTYTDEDITIGDQYCYRVKALIDGCKGDLSSEKCVRISDTGIVPVGTTALSIYPNPAKDVIILESLETVEIYDITGRLVKAADTGLHTTGVRTINVSALPKGIYLIKAGAYAGKFMKE
jgi:hypothetical protein